MSPRIFLVAGEESGDRLGAALMAAIRERSPTAQFSGVGGPQMAAAGLDSLFPLGDLAIIGFGAIVGSLPKILRRIAETADAAVAARPDALVIIDSPDFTHRVARRVRAKAPQIPIVDYVCPSVWAWRPGRAKAMRGYVDHVLALLPFEPDALRRLGGPPATYVGHPLIEELDALRPSAAEASRRMSEPPRVVALPGSRSTELRRLAPVFGEALGKAQKQVDAIEVIVPTVPRLEALVKAAVETWPLPAKVVTGAAEKQAAFRTARAALTKSGTSTLELALAGVPMVAAYKVSLIEEIVARAMIDLPTVILANLVLNERVVPEFLQRECTADALAGALLPLLGDTPERYRQIEAFARLDGIFGSGHPSAHAAEVVLSHAQMQKAGAKELVAPHTTTA